MGNSRLSPNLFWINSLMHVGLEHDATGKFLENFLANTAVIPCRTAFYTSSTYDHQFSASHRNHQMYVTKPFDDATARLLQDL